VKQQFKVEKDTKTLVS